MKAILIERTYAPEPIRITHARAWVEIHHSGALLVFRVNEDTKHAVELFLAPGQWVSVREVDEP